ncbi:MAG: tRNA-dihydrouridine synthase family protein [Chloroflexota bacterium]|nr:MAG: tRNA-dihydrouridine synthase family protein [Chloroflexota bacterium]
MSTYLDFPKPWLFLAPMDGVADWAFREVCYRFGADITVSELVSVGGVINCPQRVLPEIGARHGARPFIVQLVGHRPEEFRRAARIVTDSLPVVGIDINMGCPTALVVGSGNGSALLRNPALAAEIVAATCAGTHLPVSVKLRSGWDRPNLPEWAPLLEAAGAQLLSVHGRTREQQFGGTADHEVIAAVKRVVHIPVVGNGDIVSSATARAMLETTSVDGLMVGRGAKGNPWLFAELQAELKSSDSYRQQSISFGDVIREQSRLTFADQGPRKAPMAIRKHLAGYSRNSPSAAVLRAALKTLFSWDDVEGWIAKLEASFGQTPPKMDAPDRLGFGNRVGLGGFDER